MKWMVFRAAKIYFLIKKAAFLTSKIQGFFGRGFKGIQNHYKTKNPEQNSGF